MAKQEKDALLEQEYDAPLPVSPMLHCCRWRGNVSHRKGSRNVISQVPCPSCELENLTPGLNLCCCSIAIFSYLLFFAMSYWRESHGRSGLPIH